MQLSNTASSSDTRKHLTPKTYSGWALDRAIILDCACPGLLASTLYFGPVRRQAVFLALASIDWLGQAEIARRFHQAIEGTDALGQSDAAVIGRAILLLHRPRDFVRALFGTVPDGLLGAMQRLGHDPVGAPETYKELQRLFFSDAAADKRRVKVLGQMAGSLVGAQIEIVSLLDPVLLHPTFVANVYETKQVAELNAALAYVRARCSGATDEAVRSSLVRLGCRFRRRLRRSLCMGGVVTVLRPQGPMGNTASVGRWPLVEVPLGDFHINAAGAAENE